MISGRLRPTGTPVRVIALADRSAEGDLIIPEKARLIPFGYARSDRAHPEDLYLLDDRIVIVSGVGDAPLEQQLAGLFVVPVNDGVIGELSVLLDDASFEDETEEPGPQ